MTQQQKHVPHRGKIEIIQQILSHIDKRIDIHNEGCLQQEILNSVEMNHNQVKKYIPFLVENGLLYESQSPRFVKPHTAYRISPKGILFLKLFNEMYKDDYIYSARRRILLVK